jgi:hypothetical protein
MELLSPRRPEMFPLSNKPICAVTVLEPRPIENKCLTLEVSRADSIRRLCNRIFQVELAAISRLLAVARRASASSTLPAKSVVQSLSDLCSLRGWCSHASLRPIERPHSSADAHLRSPRTMAPSTQSSTESTKLQQRHAWQGWLR